jgi:hypothetical protein
MADIEARTHKAVKTATRMAILALRFNILTAVRPGQLYKMRWDEIHEIPQQGRVWICPKERVKKVRNQLRKDHVVPLSTAAWAVLTENKSLQEGAVGILPEFVFVRALPLPQLALYRARKRINRQRELAFEPLGYNAASTWLGRPGNRNGYSRSDFPVHGTARTSFSTWANEQLGPMVNFTHTDIELALHHIPKSTGGEFPVQVTPVALIYNKAQRLPQRRELLEAWGEFCCRRGDVISFRSNKDKVESEVIIHVFARRGTTAADPVHDPACGGNDR